MQKSILSLAVSCCLVSATAVAGDYKSEEQLTSDLEKTVGEHAFGFNDLDYDRNGFITRNEAEARPGLTDDWDSYDKNEDGQLNRAEFSAFEEEDLEDRAEKLEDAADEAEDRIDRAN